MLDFLLMEFNGEVIFLNVWNAILFKNNFQRILVHVLI